MRSGVCLILFVALALTSVAPQAGAVLLRPLEGIGNFPSTVDVLNRRQPDGSTNVVLLIAIANRDLVFEAHGGRLEGRIGVEAEVEGNDGATVRREAASDVWCGDQEQAASPSLYQVLPVVLEGVKASRGRLSVRVEDRMRERPGLLSRIRTGNWRRSESAGDWSAGPATPEAVGLTLEDPIFLSGAPIARWTQRELEGATPESSLLTGYLHPNRRYGLEQPHLQVYFEMAAPQGSAEGRAGIRVEVAAKDMGYAVHDTIRLDEAQLARLAAGNRTGVFYDLDLKDVPPGAFTLSCAPANAQGRGWAAEFDVVWSLDSLNRFADEIEGEGHILLRGAELKSFDAAGQAEREVILEKFWQAHDPTPGTGPNESYLEFLRRVSYVRQFMGGLNRAGAVDPRGQVYLLLGPPDEVQQQVLPLNEKDQQDAIARVFDSYAPEREGTQIKGEGGIPMPLTRQSQRDIQIARQGVVGEKAFELWIYNHDGWQLFPNEYSGKFLGLRFLFVDRSGSGNWRLQSTNANDASAE